MKYQVCTNCVMDQSDSNIIFDSHGVCDHCRGFEINTKPLWHPNDNGRNMLKTIVKKGATLCANCTIVCGTTVGAYAFVGAGAVVNKDVPHMH